MKNNSHHKIIIFGQGILGSAFEKIFPAALIFPREKLDICDHKKVDEMLDNFKPQTLINCAAFTRVDDAEKEKEEAERVNGEAVKNLAQICQEKKINLMHFSTDYIFDGQNPDGYDENSVPCPINFYGESKLIGEENLKKYHDQFWLIRTSSVFGAGGKNFVDTMKNLSLSKKEVAVVNDQFSSPTYATDLACACQKIINNKVDFGTYHLTNSGSCSWSDFAREIFLNLKSNCQVREIPSSTLDRPAKRPRFSVLKNTKLDPLRSWRGTLEDYLD